jgi:hypothetical protein
MGVEKARIRVKCVDTNPTRIFGREHVKFKCEANAPLLIPYEVPTYIVGRRSRWSKRTTYGMRGHEEVLGT